jgi:Rrf2 family protein
MLLARKAWYGLIAVKHLAEQSRESSLSAKDLADLYGFPQEALAKILQRLAKTGLSLSHHGIKGGYTLARDAHQVSVLDVIRASERAMRDGIHGSTRTMAGASSMVPQYAVLLELLNVMKTLKHAQIDAGICGSWVPFLKELARHSQADHSMSWDIDLLCSGSVACPGTRSGRIAPLQRLHSAPTAGVPPLTVSKPVTE